MARLHQIVSEINTTLQVRLKDKRFQKGRFSGIAELITFKDGEEDQTIPCIVDDFGDTTKLTFDDTFPFELYHRHLSGEFQDVEGSDFGDRILRAESAAMTLVAIGDRRRLSMNKEDLMSEISLGLPAELKKTFRSENGLENITITYGSWLTDPKAVYDREYSLEETHLKTNTIIVALDYTILTETWVSCQSVIC